MTTEQELRRQLRIMQESLERKNRELDALHYVWCDGGCKTGVHRWTANTVTEDVVVLSERNTARLRLWFESMKRKSSNASFTDTGIRLTPEIDGGNQLINRNDSINSPS